MEVEGVEIFDSFHMYISLDNNVYFHTWFMFRLYLYTVDITTARTFIAYISLIFHDSDQELYICFSFGVRNISVTYAYFMHSSWSSDL